MIWGIALLRGLMGYELTRKRIQRRHHPFCVCARGPDPCRFETGCRVDQPAHFANDDVNLNGGAHAFCQT